MDAKAATVAKVMPSSESSSVTVAFFVSASERNKDDE
jgi:hypothetical protein